jgi:hypothetical protein
MKKDKLIVAIGLFFLPMGELFSNSVYVFAYSLNLSISADQNMYFDRVAIHNLPPNVGPRPKIITPPSNASTPTPPSNASTPTPLNRWIVNANGLVGILSIDSIAKGKLNGSLFDHPMNGSVNQIPNSTKIAFVGTLPLKPPRVASFNGYLINTCGTISNVKATCFIMAGSFNIGSSKQEAGWFALALNNTNQSLTRKTASP